MRKLVAYFSATSVTANVANRLADAIGADVFEIRPTQVYTKEDLFWWEQESRSSIEMKDITSRPEIAKRRDNMADYDCIYLGFPVWWSVAPRIINTFLESYDLTGKMVIPFATSGGGGVEKVNQSIANSCLHAELKEASLLNPGMDFEELSAWAETIL